MKSTYSIKPTWVFLLVAAFVMFAGVLLIGKMYPIHLNSNIAYGQDPAYQYLFAGIDILLGNAPHHTDHPGTPLQSLIAGTIAVVWSFQKLLGMTQSDLYDSVLLNPEFYLVSVSGAVLFLSCAAIFFLGKRVYQATASYSLAISCQLFPFLFKPVIPNFVFPSPEALLISIVIGLLAVLAPVVLDPVKMTRDSYRKAALPAGVICGLGLATKITFFPLLGLLLLLKYPRPIIKGFAFATVGWVIGVLPIFERLPQMFSWFQQVLMHSGTHGGGSRGIFNLDQFTLSVKWLFANFPFFYYMGLCLVITLILGMSFQRFGVKKINLESDHYLKNTQFEAHIPLVISIVCLLQTVMVAKHPGVTYMIPALPLALFGGVWIINRATIFLVSQHINKWLANIWLVLICSLSSFALVGTYQTLSRIHDKGKVSYLEISEEIKKYKNPLLIGAFNCNFLACAEWFGMLLVPSMELRMAPITPDFYHFDVFNKRLHVPGIGELDYEQFKKIIDDLLAENRDVLLVSPEFEQLKVFNLEKIYGTEVQNLYRVKGVRAVP